LKSLQKYNLILSLINIPPFSDGNKLNKGLDNGPDHINGGATFDAEKAPAPLNGSTSSGLPLPPDGMYHVTDGDAGLLTADKVKKKTMGMATCV